MRFIFGLCVWLLIGLAFIPPSAGQTPAALMCWQGPTNPQWAPCNSTNPLQVSTSGAGGGAVTVANGADVALGSTTDTAAASGNVTATAEALLKGILNGVQGSVPAGTNVIGGVTLNAAPSIANGNGVVIAPTSGATASPTVVACGSAVSSCVLKNAGGNLYDVYAECTSACWLMVFAAASAPSNGSTTAGVATTNMQHCVAISAGGTGSVVNGSIPEAFVTGITAVISSTACATLTLSTVGFVHGRVQ